MEPPHKVWTPDLVAQHAHDNFHSSSWHPLRYKRLTWHKWLFGIQSRRGYSHYATYWSDTSPPKCVWPLPRATQHECARSRRPLLPHTPTCPCVDTCLAPALCRFVMACHSASARSAHRGQVGCALFPLPHAPHIPRRLQSC